MQSDTIYNLKIDLLIPNPNQPRKQFNEISLNELASSIKTYGILNPILVRKKENMYEIIAGERRYRAAKIAGLTEIPAIIKNVDENKMSEIAIIENIQRENINPIEEAKSYQEILNKKNITENELSELLGKSQPFISNKIRLLNLQLDIQEALINKKISEKHARSLLKIKNEAQQIALLKRIINEKLSVKDLDKIIDNDKTNKQREEKESDNMNNGNFFPNIEQNTTPETNQLNPMNMQPMTPPQPTEAAPTPDPVVNPIPDFSVQPENNANIAQNTQADAPLFGGMEVSNTPSPTDIPQPDTNINVNPIMPEQPVVPEVPVMEQPVAEEPIVEPTQPVVDPPLFGGMETPATPLEPAVDIPVVETPAAVEPTGAPTFETVEALLNSNGISYKAYSNETGHCIIIEI